MNISVLEQFMKITFSVPVKIGFVFQYWIYVSGACSEAWWRKIFKRELLKILVIKTLPNQFSLFPLLSVVGLKS